MKRHALIIEDSMLVAMTIRDHLESCGYDVAVASSKAQAISSAQLRCPDLITAEDNLEDGSGIDAIREICRDKSIPVIFIVTNSERVEREQPGAVILHKPFTQSALAEAMMTAEMFQALLIASANVAA